MIGPDVVVLAVDAGALVVSCPSLKWPKSNSKVQYGLVGVRKKTKQTATKKKRGGGQASRPREGDFHAPSSPRWGTDGRSCAGTS